MKEAARARRRCIGDARCLPPQGLCPRGRHASRAARRLDGLALSKAHDHDDLIGESWRETGLVSGSRAAL